MYEDFSGHTSSKRLNLLKITPRNVRGSVKVGLNLWVHLHGLSERHFAPLTRHTQAP
jgi:hypothetical protein